MKPVENTHHMGIVHIQKALVLYTSLTDSSGKAKKNKYTKHSGELDRCLAGKWLF